MNDLTNASLQDINGSSLLASLPDPHAKETPHYLVEYGVRPDDMALVFHFFPPKTGWEESWRMDKRLDRAIRETFPVSRVSADFQEEIQSFCVIFGAASAPDPISLAPSFLAWIDAPLEEPS